MLAQALQSLIEDSLGDPFPDVSSEAIQSRAMDDGTRPEQPAGPDQPPAEQAGPLPLDPETQTNIDDKTEVSFKLSIPSDTSVRGTSPTSAVPSATPKNESTPVVMSPALIADKGQEDDDGLPEKKYAASKFLTEAKNEMFDCISTIYSAVTYHELFLEAALDANGQLEFGIEWQDVLHALLETWLPDKRDVDEDHLRAVFDAIDVNSNGSLDEDELYRCFRELGASVSRENVRSFIFLCDDDGNGTVEFDEFLRVFRVIEEMQRRNADAKAEACEAVVEL